MQKENYTNISDQELLDKFKRDQDNLWLGILLQRYTPFRSMYEIFER